MRSLRLPLGLRLKGAACIGFISLLLAVAAHAQVVINEINFRPGTAVVENTTGEFIELYNADAAAVTLDGWQFTRGVAFTFPTGTTVPAGGYIVVAANVVAFQAAYPAVSNVVGGWTGSLSNSAEKIELRNAALVVRDTVSYADEGDWALRVREATWNGWDWQSLAKTGGRTLELRNAAVDNNNGQNWGDSAAVGGTPGSVNSIVAANTAPFITKVKHFPAVPRSTEPVTISCELVDETSAGLSATLFWRDATSTVPGSFQSLAMTGDGAGKYSATLTAKTNLTIVEFYIGTSDGALSRTWPAPTSEGQNANCQYQVDNEVGTATDSYYRMVLTAAENSAFNSVSSSSDRQFNQTLVVTRGTETDIRYRSAMRIRGNSSRSYQFKPLRISVPGDDTLDGATGFNINPRSSHLQYLGMRIFQSAGVRAADAIPVELRRNGVESTTSSGSTPDFGKWVRMQELGSELVDNHWPEADTGNLYKKGRPDQYWRATAAAPGNADGILDGFSKQNNGSANDWSDLTGFFQVVQTAAAPHFPGSAANDVAGSGGSRTTGAGLWDGTGYSAGEIANLETVSDLDQWARWLAVMTILQDNETNISNGEDDDYAVYFLPSAGGQRRMQLLPHDMDTILGLGDAPLSYNSRGLYDSTDESSVFRPLLPLLGNSTTAGNAAFRTKYHDALRDLLGTVLNADTAGNPNPPFHQFVDSHLTGWAPAGTIASIKSFATQRQAHLLALIGSGATTPPPATSSATATSTAGVLTIHEVLANNVTAHANGATFPDVIELRNTGATSIALAGKSLTDDPLVPAKYVFPAGTTIPANGFLVVYADSDAVAPGLHAGFSLDQTGEQVRLYDSVANGQTLLDAIAFGAQPADHSIGRMPAALGTWTLCTPTIGTVNSPVSVLAPPSGVRINEWLGNPDYVVTGDFVELYNPAADPVALGGMVLTDDFINYPAKRVLPQLSFMAPGSFLRFDAKGSAASPGNATELPFGIDGTVGWLALIGQNGTIADRVDIVAQIRDTSRGLSPDGALTVANFGLPTSVPTPGASNVAPPAGILALFSGLRVTEILYAPSALEFIEMENIGATTLDLSGVRFTSGISYTFPPGTTLAPSNLIVVCRDRAAFQAQFGTGIVLAPGQFTGSLDNAGETIAFQPPAPWDANILSFAYDATWYPGTSTGYSLYTASATATPSRDWGDRSTWLASAGLYGTPGSNGPPVISSALTAGASVGQAFSYQITATKFPTSYGAAPLPAGLSFNAGTGLISGSPTAAGTTNVSITATNSAGADTKTLVLTVINPALPVVTSGGTASGTLGDVFSTYQITATNIPTSYGASGLPAGLTVNAGTGAITGTPTVSGTFSVVISATNSTGTGTKTLTITLASSGPLTRFSWGAIGSPKQAGVPFNTTVRALDAANRTVTTFTGTVSLLNGAGRPPAIIGTGTDTWNYPFRTFWHDSRTQCIYLASEIGGGGTISALTLDVTTIPGQTMNNWTIRVKHTAMASYATNSWEGTGWTTALQTNQPQGATGPVTFVFTTPFVYDGTSNLMVDFSHNNTSYTNDGYVRSTATATNRTLTYYTDSGYGDPLNWSGTSNPFPQANARIPNITLTFSGSAVSMTPATTTNFVNGLWSGAVTVGQAYSGLTLRADDGAGHTGTSSAFNVVLPPVPVVTSPTSALAVIGQPFSYQIFASGFIASYNATNLPAALGVNTATGLVSGTPAAAGTSAVTVSAINAGGSGNATLSLQVQADADGDGMGDAWETANGLSVGTNDSASDLDGDGQSNLAEWLAGTAPNSSSSRLTILSQVIAGSNVQLTWGAVVGRRYRVLTRADLAAGSWTDLTPTPIVATATTGSYTHTGGFTGGAGYYRVEIVP